MRNISMESLEGFLVEVLMKQADFPIYECIRIP